VTTENVVVCGSAYMPSAPGVEAIQRAILPVMTYVSVTEPLGSRLAEVLGGPHAVTGECARAHFCMHSRVF
jgi:glycine/D-amino acid oxidase-like deaminating enzyme